MFDFPNNPGDCLKLIAVIGAQNRLENVLLYLEELNA